MFPLNKIATALANRQDNSAPVPMGTSLPMDAGAFPPGKLEVKVASEPDWQSHFTAGTGRGPAVVKLGMEGVLKNYAIAGIVVWQDDQAYLLREHGLPTLRLMDGCKPIEGDVTLYGDVHSEHGRLTFKENGCVWEFQKNADAPAPWSGEDIQ